LGVPAFVAAPVPMLSPTRAFPVPGLVKQATLGGTLNKASYRLSAKAAGVFRGTVDEWRQEVLDMPKAPHGVRDVNPDGTPLPKLYAYSEAVLPRPRDWGEDTIVTGYWELGPPPDWTPPPALEAFLAQGPPPVYVGFGSMPVENIAQEITDALRAANVRGLLAHPLETTAPDMRTIGDIPHSWLFPRVAAVVHHGGAGTTGAALIAGKPSVVMPQGVDQPFWARVVERQNA